MNYDMGATVLPVADRHGRGHGMGGSLDADVAEHVDRYRNGHWERLGPELRAAVILREGLYDGDSHAMKAKVRSGDPAVLSVFADYRRLCEVLADLDLYETEHGEVKTRSIPSDVEGAIRRGDNARIIAAAIAVLYIAGVAHADRVDRPI